MKPIEQTFRYHLIPTENKSRLIIISAEDYGSPQPTVLGNVTYDEDGHITINIDGRQHFLRADKITNDTLENIVNQVLKFGFYDEFNFIAQVFFIHNSCYAKLDEYSVHDSQGGLLGKLFLVTDGDSVFVFEDKSKPPVLIPLDVINNGDILDYRKISLFISLHV